MNEPSATQLPTGWIVVSKALAVFWYVVAAALILWGSLYLLILVVPARGHTVSENAFALVFTYVMLFAAALIAMFYGEGTEVAVAMLIDKDPEQIPQRIRDGFIALRDSHIPFISGRQLIVVTAIVGMTVLCLNVADVPADRQNAIPYTGALTTPAAREIFAILFPTFFALWFIQLPPKFMAHNDPLGAYSWQLTRVAVRCSLFLGKWLHVEGPSQQVTALLTRLQPPTHEVLRPSRENYYKLSATLRDGRARELVDIDMFVDHNGAIRVVEVLKFRAFARGFQKVHQAIAWEAKFKSARLVVSEFGGPADCTVRGPRFFDRPNAQGLTMYWVTWDLDLKESLEIGKPLALVVSYQTGPNATRSRDAESDSYGILVDVPTAEIVLRIQPEEGTALTFFDGHAVAETSENDEVNRDEAKLVEVQSYGPEGRGYLYHAHFPLFGTKLEFHWTVRRTSPAPAPFVHIAIPDKSAALVTYLPASDGDRSDVDA